MSRGLETESSDHPRQLPTLSTYNEIVEFAWHVWSCFCGGLYFLLSLGMKLRRWAAAAASRQAFDENAESSRTPGLFHSSTRRPGEFKEVMPHNGEGNGFIEMLAVPVQRLDYELPVLCAVVAEESLFPQGSDHCHEVGEDDRT